MRCIIYRKRKEPKSFAVHYLKEGPKMDQTVGSEQLYVTGERCQTVV